MDGRELIRTIRDGLGLRNAEFAELLGVESDRVIRRYLAEERTPNGAVTLRALQVGYASKPEIVLPILEGEAPELPVRPVYMPNGQLYPVELWNPYERRQS